MISHTWVLIGAIVISAVSFLCFCVMWKNSELCAGYDEEK